MNVKDFRAKAYTKNAEGIPVPVNETPSVQKSENNFQKTVFTKDIKAEDLTQKKQSPSQALDNTVDYLKTGGLLKVPVEQIIADMGTEQFPHALMSTAMMFYLKKDC